MESPTLISYKPHSLFPGWLQQGGEAFIANFIRQYGCKQILEVGGGANPTLSPETVRDLGLTYTVSDIDPEELEKAETGFHKVLLDLSTANLDFDAIGHFDCIFSRMVGEHITDGRQFHANIHRLLRPGGISIHCFSALGAAPFLANYLLPDSVASAVYYLIDPRDPYKHGKFPARYEWCRGPTKAMLRRFEELGFDVLEYNGYFGHNYYRRFSLLNKAELLKARLLLRNPAPHLCSYATVLLRKR